MIGAIIGDIVGSIYEFNNIRTKDFLFFSPRCFFTDDSVMTIAISNALIECNGDYSKLQQKTIEHMQDYGAIYPNLSYGCSFSNWLDSENPKPYNSFGNGAAMRVSAVAYFANSLAQVKQLSYLVTSVTHNHEEGIKGAEATAVAIWMAKNNYTKEEIKDYIERNYYSLNFDYEDLRQNYKFNEICQDTVPQAIYCFLISNSFEDAIRTGISIGGDSDTLCAITGAIAEAYYGVGLDMKNQALTYLDDTLKKDYENFLKHKLG